MTEEEGVVIVEAVEDWKGKEDGAMDGSWKLVGGTGDEEEVTVVGAVERGWFWGDIEFDGVMNEGMDDWDDEERIGGEQEREKTQ